jgi:hypothetical protein
VREATAAQHAQWKRSRDQAISDGEIDLDAGNDPDEWNVYLLGASRTNSAAQTLAFDPGEKSLQLFQCLSKRPRLSPSEPLELPYATNKYGNSDGKITIPVVSLIDLLSA